MCQNPVLLQRIMMENTLVPCRNCEACKRKRLRQWTGRINAEAATGSRVDFITLTYADREDGHEKALHYKDVQLFFKVLRKAGHSFKYVVVGEYGSKRGRAHWHVVMIWHSKPPTVKMGERINWEYWPHGFTQIEAPRSIQGTAAYVMKYLSKDTDAEVRYSQSIGFEYIKQRSRQKARDGLPLFKMDPESYRDKISYTVEGNQTTKGELYWYPVDRGTSLHEHMVRAYLEEWAIIRPDQTLPACESVYHYFEEWVQNPIEHPQLAVYAERHYGYKKAGVFSVDQSDANDILERTLERWRKQSEELNHGLPNEVQAVLYRLAAKELTQSLTQGLPLQRPKKRRTAPQHKDPP